MSVRRAVSTAVLGLVIAAALLFHVIAAQPLFAQEKSKLAELQDKTIELLDKTREAIVAIHCKVEGKKPSQPRLPLRRPRRRKQNGSYFGTGTVITKDGYILTSTSVVPPKAKDIKVYFRNGRVSDAKLVSYEIRNNVTLLKIEATGLFILPLGSSKDVRVGQVAFTLGNPYDTILNDRQVAFSMGIISGIYRLRGDGDYYGNVIETDAALNAGSDGGPLVNAKGEVVGILNLSYSYTKWLNVAVPIDQIKLILDDLKKDSKVYPRYGFEVDEEPMPGGGAEVVKVSRGGAARKAGMKRGDMVLEMDGLQIERPDHLEVEMTRLPPGTEVTFLVRRGDEEIVIKFISDKFVEKQKENEPEPEVEPEPETEPEPEPEPEPEIEPEPEPVVREPGTMGVRVTEDKGQLVISKITEGGAADSAGILPQDELLAINGERVKSLEEIAAILKNFHAGDTIKLLVNRQGAIKEIEVILAKK